MPELILIVEDEADIANTVAFNLQQDGFATHIAPDASSALAFVARSSPAPALVLLDLMLPDMPGTEVCRRLRQSPATRRIPIVMLTARTEAIDRVVGFELGADDYVTKPFSVRELVLRVRAVLRRAKPDHDTPDVEDEVVSFGNLRIDFEGHRVWVSDTEIVLTALEFRLLTTLIKRRGRVQTRETLLTDVWEMHGDVTTRTVDTHVRRLRKKLGGASGSIETLRGVGYRFQTETVASAD
ncbi:MAG: response regulator transcription factor [Nannocystaceae bacterium]|nr:response regulator transcription factor [Nannocystaceae bacterium]